MKKTGPGRPQTSVNTGKSYALAEWLNENLNELSMWKTGKTRVALHALKGIARLANTPLEQLFPMWVEQYAREKGLKAQPYLDMLGRIVSPAEYELVMAVRAAGFDAARLSDDHRNILSLMLMEPRERAEIFGGH